MYVGMYVCMDVCTYCHLGVDMGQLNGYDLRRSILDALHTTLLRGRL
jgi:hypothetical protein